jgi:two-component system, NarL family, nitrate/nitrite response regulator NarL
VKRHFESRCREKKEEVTIKVLVVDDHKLFAEAIRAALTHRGMEVIGLAGTAHEAVAVASREQPDLVLQDLGLPDESGLEAGKKILAACPRATILAVTALNDASAVREVMRAGFHGYVTKDTPLPQFIKSIEASLSGQVVIPYRLSSRAGGRISAEEEHASLLVKQLTPRELKVLALLAEGASGAVMAERLCISRNTIRSHVQNILTKLQVHSRLEAAAFAVKHGIVKPSADAMANSPTAAEGS